MFKNLLVYRFEENSLLSNAETLEQFEAALSAKPLTAPLTQEWESLGWIKFFKDSQYVEKINNALFINLGIETKQLPDKAVKTEVEKRIEENLDAEDDPLLQMQAELYLAVDLYRKMISHIYNQVNTGR